LPREGLPVIAGLPDVETRSEYQEKVGTLHGEVSGAVADRALPSAKERVVGGDQVVRPGSGDGHAETVAEFVEFNGGMSGADAGAGEYHRSLCPSDSIENFPAIGRELLAVNRIECAFILGRVVAAKRRGIDGHALDIHRDVEPARTGASTLREVPGALEVVADGKWIVDQYCIFGNVRDHGDDVGFLVSELAQARDPQRAHAGFTLDLAGDDQHRNGVGPRPEDPVERVDAARSGVTLTTPGSPLTRA